MQMHARLPRLFGESARALWLKGKIAVVNRKKSRARECDWLIRAWFNRDALYVGAHTNVRNLVRLISRKVRDEVEDSKLPMQNTPGIAALWELSR